MRIPVTAAGSRTSCEGATSFRANLSSPEMTCVRAFARGERDLIGEMYRERKSPRVYFSKALHSADGLQGLEILDQSPAAGVRADS
jgi:hypothetical protein